MEIAATEFRVAREQARQRRRAAQRKQQRHAERQAACDRELTDWIASTVGPSAASELDRPTWMALFVQARSNANDLQRQQLRNMRTGHLDVGRSPPSPGPPPPSPSPPSPSPPPLFLEMVDDVRPSPPSPSPPSPSPPPPPPPPPPLLEMVDDVWPPILSRLGEHGLCAVACTCSYLRNHEAVAREQAKVWAMNEAINMFIGALAASTAEARYQAFPAPPPTRPATCSTVAPSHAKP